MAGSTAHLERLGTGGPEERDQCVADAVVPKQLVAAIGAVGDSIVTRRCMSAQARVLLSRSRCVAGSPGLRPLSPESFQPRLRAGPAEARSTSRLPRRLGPAARRSRLLGTPGRQQTHKPWCGARTTVRRAGAARVTVRRWSGTSCGRDRSRDLESIT
jgi:hypothetical protein